MTREAGEGANIGYLIQNDDDDDDDNNNVDDNT